MWKWLTELKAQWRCLLRGHDGLIERAGSDLFLRCTRCGRRSPGITVDATPILKFPGDPRRLRGDLPCHRSVVERGQPLAHWSDDGRKRLLAAVLHGVQDGGDPNDPVIWIDNRPFRVRAGQIQVDTWSAPDGGEIH